MRNLVTKPVFWNVVALVGFIAWAYTIPDWEPILGVIAAFGALVLQVTRKKPIPQLEKNDDRLDPQLILKRIKKLPSYQQQLVRESYVGQPVKWKVVFDSVNRISIGWMVVNRPFGNDVITPQINFEVLLIDNYPLLKLANKGDKFTVTGTIKNIHNLWIDIDMESFEPIS